MTEASKVTLQKLFSSSNKINETFSQIENILPNLELKNLKTKISTPPSYLLFHCTAFQRKGEIQINFEAAVEKTLIYIDWSYNINIDCFEKSVMSQYHYDKFEEIRVKIAATEISSLITFTESVKENSATNDVKSKKHAKYVSNQNRFLQVSCPKCRETFQNPKDLRKHRDEEHKTKKVDI